MTTRLPPFGSAGPVPHAAKGEFEPAGPNSYTGRMAKWLRHDGRAPGDLRPVRITPDFVSRAAGSCLFEAGGTRVICTASFARGVPDWRQGRGQGWLTAEYGMLPASTGVRKARPGIKGDSRGTEIRRLIGRVLRNAVDTRALGENTVTIDCDVLEADGGTRTAAITGGYVALAMALARRAEHCAAEGALCRQVAAISVGMVDGHAVCDLDYAEDASADVDLNVAATSTGRYLEVQGTSERKPFTGTQLQAMLALARKGIRHLVACQDQALKEILP